MLASGRLARRDGMVIKVDSDLEAALTTEAKRRGVSPEALAVDALRQRFLPRPLPFEPRDEWERRLLAIGTDCGVSLPDSAFSSDELYD
jgi:predicted transcriptional regulator